MDCLPLFSNDYLHSIWREDFDKYCEESVDEIVLSRLKQWSQRDLTLTETQTESVFIQQFFVNTWGFWGTGVNEKEKGFCFQAQYGVGGAGQTGGKGSADLALGWWECSGVQPVPQVLCEFKDIRSGLDAKQKRKGNDRSPVKQCFDYLKHAFDQTDINSTLTPSWGLVTDMNEFRLYYRKAGDASCQVFVIDPKNSSDDGLLAEDDMGKFNRFLFWKIFQRDMLLANFGRSGLEKTLENQWVLEEELEEGFYLEYKAYRERVYDSVVKANPEFKETRGKLVKLTQRFLDRCIFILFCEDMGKTLDFPENLLRDMLIEKSKDKYYSADGGNIWDIIKQLFSSMRDGGIFPPNHNINRFNGGLFEEFSELEDLKFPNSIFCAKGQGENHESLVADRTTLLYLAANYNFGAHGSKHERTITLYALGRVFEQSITELEYMEAKADGRKSLVELSKRKRDGVYYTPEWVTAYIVKETVGTLLEEIQAELGVEYGCELDKEDWLKFKRSFSKTRKAAKSNKALLYYNKLIEYQRRLNCLKILDPSCGSGAFLIQALKFLMTEQVNLLDELRRVSGEGELLENWEEGVMRSILSNNLYGVDINPESVEITQLALWLNTALPGKPLSNLDAHIRSGNSLVGSDYNNFYKDKQGMEFNNAAESFKERVNVFDWEEAFPEVLGNGIPNNDRGFDCIIGNPPYVKLQHFKTLQPDVCEYISTRNDENGCPVYESARTGSFDLYLVFIEKGIGLLNIKGRMGYIAPSLWLKNEYGLGLRQKIKRDGNLERWIDFKSFQVFDEATTYTSLQFYTKKKNRSIRFYIASDGEITPIDWSLNEEECRYKYSKLDDIESWNLMYAQEGSFIEKMKSNCLRLGDSDVTSHIFQGHVTSADKVYHLEKISENTYRQHKGDMEIYEIEDEAMHPLVSGAEAKRYQLPSTNLYLLFPYKVNCKLPHVFTSEELLSEYPKTFKYLKKHEDILKNREYPKMNIAEGWWGYVYPKNLDKQDYVKLGVPTTVPRLRVFADVKGEFYFNNVRVNGVLPRNKKELSYLLGILNAPVCDFVFKRIAKDKDGGYFEANKQFILPLPIPVATLEEKEEVGLRAENLQELHTTRRDKLLLLQRRLDSEQCIGEKRKESWLWAEVKTVAQIKKEAPEGFSPKEKTEWSKNEYLIRLNDRLEKIDAILKVGATLSAENNFGELSFKSNGVAIIEGVFLDDSDSEFICAQWRQVARSTNVTEKFKAKKLIGLLLKLKKTENDALVNQVVNIDAEILELDKQIELAENELNQLTYKLYKLTDEEIRLVEKG